MSSDLYADQIPLYSSHAYGGYGNGQYIKSGVSAPLPSRLPQTPKVEPVDNPWLFSPQGRHSDNRSSAFAYTPSASSSSPSPVLPSVSTGQSSTDSRTWKTCAHCGATSTPLWRREPVTLRPLCNACGLYLQQRGRLRPQELIDADNDEDSGDEGAGGDGTRPECSHCHTHHTSVWRRTKTGEQICNACGVYSRLKGVERPLSLKKNKIKPRSKHVVQQLE
ncbi:hypothetical protein C8J56DRAFT_860567 [Mycena floridula]|nr:hypothetical protein C8J56DRAFT_861872 [Mycena floridula]KAJ7588877.1 hypothetical protein C8J56DRAFT_860567 [Mycena floridula]